MNEVATIEFVDVDSGDDAIAVVRAACGQVALCFSLKQNGDIEIFLRAKDCERLVEALQRAISAANSP